MSRSASASFTESVLPAGRPSDAGEAAWMRAFATGRIGQLGLVFAALPLVLAVAPALVAATLPVLVATMLSAAGGLLGLRYLSSRSGALCAVTGMAILGFAPWMGGLPGATAGAALVALALEVAVLPGQLRQDRLVQAGFGLAAVLILAVGIGTTSTTEGMAQAAAALICLPLAPVITLLHSAAASREALEERDAVASTAARRDAIMIAAADVAIAVVDRGAHAVDVSAAAARLLAATPQDITGRGLIDRVLIADRPAMLKAVSDAATAGLASNITVRLATFTAGERSGPPSFAPFDLVVRPVSDGSGHVALRLAPAAPAAPVDVNRTALFATLSHEVRTPMNAILGFSEILANPALQPKMPAQIAEYAGIIHRSAHDAFAVTRAVVDLLRVESPDFAPAPEWVDIRDMAAKIVAGLSDRVDCATCSVIATDTAFEMEADIRALRMLLSNLIEGLANAGGKGASLVCSFDATPRTLALDITCTPQVPAAGRLGHAAYLGVVEALARRIASLIGGEITLSLGDDVLSAALRLPVVAAVVMPLAPPHPSNIQSIRKSA